MGAGKSRYGKYLAHNIGYTFYDLDRYIESHENNSMTKIFAVHGESGFRKKEFEYLRHIANNNVNIVISVGGGTPCYLDNMDYMNDKGHTVFLNTPIDMIISRLIKCKHKRPLIKNIDDCEMCQFVVEHLKSRLPYYNKAKQILSPDEFGNFPIALETI